MRDGSCAAAATAATKAEIRIGRYFIVQQMYKAGPDSFELMVVEKYSTLQRNLDILISYA